MEGTSTAADERKVLEKNQNDLGEVAMISHEIFKLKIKLKELEDRIKLAMIRISKNIEDEQAASGKDNEGTD